MTRKLQPVFNHLLRGLIPITSMKKGTRAALLASKRTIDSNMRFKREELLALPSAFNEKQTANEKTA